MDYDDIVTALGRDVTSDLEDAVERAFIRSRELESSRNGPQALQQLMVSALATIIGLPSEREHLHRRLRDATSSLHEIVHLMAEIEIGNEDELAGSCSLRSAA